MPSLKTFRIPVAATVIAVIAAGVLDSVEVALILALLCVLEISISFDNAIVNATVLKTMTPKWQQVFLTWGILIAVFGMRLIFPIVIVAAAAGLGIPEVVNQALTNHELYATNLREANAVIAAFGGMFLLMVFLSFFVDEEKDEHWLGVERPLTGLATLASIGPAIGAITLLIVSQIVNPAKQAEVLVAGLAGLICYLVASGVAERLEPEAVEEEGREESAPVHSKGAGSAAVGAAAKGGLATFLYLELLDASFSFDGVIGAFAISKNIIIIAIGLGLGALYIRTLTVYLVRQGTLDTYRYLEHGAHWAIGVLAVLLFIGIEHHVPEVVTGLLGAGLIIAAFLSSLYANRKDERRADPSTTIAPEGST
ncbi:MAG: uncharacterized protein QOK16_1961 [Solirubrobacteraceae bacterium]|nr:uncharacterized protein [Solirubrobacteraceae bacterium]MEA2186950.1 uncharacterized protein [Solirubrobacteraceae bacterium]